MNTIEIPPITDPLGKYWDQPSQEEILVDENHAVMTPATMSKLSNYGHTNPTGCYAGKMWRRAPNSKEPGLFCWMSPDPDPGYIQINVRPILLV